MQAMSGRFKVGKGIVLMTVIAIVVLSTLIRDTEARGVVISGSQGRQVVTTRGNQSCGAVRGLKLTKLPETGNGCTEMGSAYWTEYINGMEISESERAWLLATSQCESGRRNCAFSGYYKGIMQYDPKIFKNAGGKNIWDGAEQLRLALAHYRVHGSGAWPVCGK